MLLLVPPNPLAHKKLLSQFQLSSLPVGLSYIAAVLEGNGFSPTIMDLSFPDFEMEKLREKTAQLQPDIVGISSMTRNFQTAVMVARKIKLWNPACIVVMGGIHATFMHREILATVPEVDVVVRYEGEYTMSELTHAFSRNISLQSVRGISFREEDKVVSTPIRSRIEDLDRLPYPAYHLLEPNVEEYLRQFRKRNFPMMTTRGCPFSCIYCSTMAFHGRMYRTRSISNVLGELEYLIEKYKADNISFADDNFTMQNDRVFELCNQMKKRGIAIEWGCSARVDQVSEELLKSMKAAGCTDIFFGIESASQRVLNLIRKGFRVRQAKDAVKIAERLGIRTHCSFIVGLPGESSRTLSNMIRFIDETKPSGRVIPNALDILPGTELAEKEEEYFANQPTISSADVTKTQLGILTTFYRNNYGVTDLFNVAPPDVIFE